MKVSIIMPSYNVIDYIDFSIGQVLEQTYKNWELLIIDDLSSDGTFPHILAKYGQDKRIKIFSNETNSGAGFSRNRGLQEATGRFIAFLDSDDMWETNKLELQVAHMLKHNAPISHTSYSFIDQLGNKRAGYVKVSNVVDLKCNLKKTEIGTSTAMIDKDIVGSNFCFELMRSRQDLLLWINLLGKNHKSHGLDIPLVKYRVRDGQVSGNKLKMLYVTFFVYMNIKELPISQRLSCFFYYATNALAKRIK